MGCQAKCFEKGGPSEFGAARGVVAEGNAAQRLDLAGTIPNCLDEFEHLDDESVRFLMAVLLAPSPLARE